MPITTQNGKVVTKTYNLGHGVPVNQGEVVGAVNDFAEPTDVILCAAGSLPGILHKLWRTEDHKGFHLEYGYSTMGYEIGGGPGAEMAAPEKQIYIMVGDGNYLMMNHEIITSIQEGYKLSIILLNNNCFASIGGLSESLGGHRFGTKYRYRDEKTGQISGEYLPVDFAENAKSLGAFAIKYTDIASLKEALVEMKKQDKTTVIYIETDLYENVPGYAWWEVGRPRFQKLIQFRQLIKNIKKPRKINVTMYR